MNRNRVAFATAFIEAALYWSLLAGLASISIWSFAQTWQFTNKGVEVGLEQLFQISFWLAIVIQYSQNAFLFLAFVSKNKTYSVTDKISINVRYIYMLGWVVTSLVDAGTNIGQWRTDNPITAATINIYSITWQLICVSCIFVEEMFIKAFGITLHKTNEFFVSMGFGGLNMFWLPELMDSYGIPEKHQKQTDFVSHNPSQAHQERIMKEHGLMTEQGQQSQGNGKKKGSWVEGKPGRRPNWAKEKNKQGKGKVPGLDAIMNQRVKDE